MWAVNELWALGGGGTDYGKAWTNPGHASGWCWYLDLVIEKVIDERSQG